LLIGPAAAATFAAFELWHAGTLAAISVGWLVFVLCMFAIGTWGKFQLERSRRRLLSLRGQRSRKTR